VEAGRPTGITEEPLGCNGGNNSASITSAVFCSESRLGVTADRSVGMPKGHGGCASWFKFGTEQAASGVVSRNIGPWKPISGGMPSSRDSSCCCCNSREKFRCGMPKSNKLNSSCGTVVCEAEESCESIFGKPEESIVGERDGNGVLALRRSDDQDVRAV
jgi:hypothetical protein